MNTTTTNTTAATISRAAIMTAAHAATRATIAAAAWADYRATFAAAMATEWENAKTAAALTATATGDAAAELAAAMVDGDAFYDRLLNMVYYAKRTDGRGFADGTPTPERFTWCRTADDLRAVAHEAYTLIFDMVEKYPEKPLAVVMYRAALNAARRIDRAERRNARAIRFSAADGEQDESRAYIIDNAAPMARERAADPYHAAALADMVERAAADDTDRRIIAAAAIGMTQAETAPLVGMSQRAVSKRLAKIRERWSNE